MHSKESNPIADAAEGITKGIISLSIDKIKELVSNFRDRKLVFINNKETIDLVKEQLKSGDWSLCQQYIKSRELKILIQMGLTLRRLESKPEQLQDLRTKILNKYQSHGLHVAQVVQNGILTEFIASVAGKVHSSSQIVEKIEGLLSEVDKFVIFIKKNDLAEKRVTEITIRLQANNPDAMILFSSKSAVSVGKKIKDSLEKNLTDYTFESREGKNKHTIFIFHEDTDMFDKEEN